MRRRRSRLPKGSRTAGRIVKFLGFSGTGMLLLVCLIVSFAAIGSKTSPPRPGRPCASCPTPPAAPGVEVFGDSTLTGLAHELPTTLAGGKVVEDVQCGRTAQQGENALNNLPDSAPAIFVMSLAEDDTSSASAYTDRIDELVLLMSGRTVYWVTAPGKSDYTAVVNKENTADPTDPENTGGWNVVDFAASVTQHPDWWSGGKPTAAGLKNLTQTLTSQIGTSTGGPGTGGGGDASGITVTSNTDTHNSFKLAGDRLSDAQSMVSVGTGMGVPQPGIVIAMATALQESKLVNLTGGPGGAYGLFQQTPPGLGSIALRDSGESCSFGAPPLGGNSPAAARTARIQLSRAGNVDRAWAAGCRAGVACSDSPSA